MSQISEEVLKDIEKKQITPKPKWLFLLKNYVIWAFFPVFVALSSLAVSTILFIVTTHDWDVYDYLGRTFLEYVFISIPYFWLIIFSLLISAAYYSFAHTKYGYRQTLFRIFLGSMVFGLILGAALFLLGVDSEIHEALSKKVPFYNNLIYYKEDVWDKPEKGLLAGEVTDLKNKNDFLLRDFEGHAWKISGDNIIWADNVIPQKGAEIKIIGQWQGDSLFYGSSIRRW